MMITRRSPAPGGEEIIRIGKLGKGPIDDPLIGPASNAEMENTQPTVPRHELSEKALTIRNKRRVRVLLSHLSELIPRGARVLDVGCGDGVLACLLLDERPDIEIRGLDVHIRNRTTIPIDKFDGRVIPYPDASFDVVMFVNVLHHTEDPTILLREAVRVASKSILIKDHTSDGFMAGATLRFMDWVGNIGLGVPLPYEFWPRQRWMETFRTLGLRPASWKSDLGLYPWPATWIFDRSLHFVARLEVS